jgi:putative phosphoribosyl transferase
MATLLMDLLTAHEERTVDLRFDIPLLAGRVVVATQWLQRRTDTGHLPIGYFGASTGAAAALVAAARNPGDVFAVVSRGGRPDLAGDALASVSAPTLLIVGGRDEAVLAVNRDALGSLNPASQLEIVPGATHLFEEPGTLERVTQLAAEWFRSHLPPGQ